MHRFTAMLAVWAGVLMVLALPALGQDNRNYPAFVSVSGLAIQGAGLISGSGPIPQATGTPNNAKYYIFARLTRNTSVQPPFSVVVVPRQSYSLTQLNPGAPPTTVTCDATSPTLLICDIGPGGATWVPGGPLVFALEIQDTSGFKTVALYSTRVP